MIGLHLPTNKSPVLISSSMMNGSAYHNEAETKSLIIPPTDIPFMFSW
jgi:hypothetical protein